MWGFHPPVNTYYNIHSRNSQIVATLNYSKKGAQRFLHCRYTGVSESSNKEFLVCKFLEVILSPWIVPCNWDREENTLRCIIIIITIIIIRIKAPSGSAPVFSNEICCFFKNEEYRSLNDWSLEFEDGTNSRVDSTLIYPSPQLSPRFFAESWIKNWDPLWIIIMNDVVHIYLTKREEVYPPSRTPWQWEAFHFLVNPDESHF